MKRVISDETVEREHKAGKRRISAPPSSSVITPAAWSKARELGVDFDRDEAPKRPAQAATLVRSTTQTAQTKKSKHAPQGSAKREVLPSSGTGSGIVVVRGGSVVLGEFKDAGAGIDVGLHDVVTDKDGPMGAGFMSFGREDSFPWTLDYAEVDYVVEGVLRVEVADSSGTRSIEARVGDVVSIPKGSKIVFATPSRVKVFYVTYPANWASLAQRPQK